MPAGGEYYVPVQMAAGSTHRLTSGRIGGFIRTSAEATLTITRANGEVLGPIPMMPGFNRLSMALNSGEGTRVSLDALGAGILLI